MPGAGVRSLAGRIAELPRPLLVALDVDGTIAPIAPEPAGARVPTATRRAIAELARVPDVHTAFVTGRDPGSLRQVVKVPGVWRAVEHGRRLIAPGERARVLGLDEFARERLTQFRAWVRREAEPRGALLEDKEGAVAVHVRALEGRDPDLAREVLQGAEDEASRLGLHVRRGRAVCEAEVAQGDKGTALQRLVDKTGARGVVYAGDDITDYPAIRTAAERDGIGLFVRSEERRDAPHEATEVLDGPEQVGELIASLVDQLKNVRKRG